MNFQAFYRHVFRSGPLAKKLWPYYAHKFLGLPNVYRIKRHIKRIVPRQGDRFMEMQIGPLVIQWCKPKYNHTVFQIWLDGEWKR